jgi:hypothetical protein
MKIIKKIFKKIFKMLKIIFWTFVPFVVPRSANKSTKYYASRWGCLEHLCGRLTGFGIFLAGLACWAGLYDVTFWGIVISFVFWLIYLISHNIEHALYHKSVEAGEGSFRFSKNPNKASTVNK